MMRASIFATVLGLGVATPVWAADEVDLSAVVKTACAGVADPGQERSVPLGRIAEGIFFQIGYPPSRLLGTTAVAPEAYLQLLVDRVVSPPATMDRASRQALLHYVRQLGQELAPGSSITPKARGLRLTSPYPADTVGRPLWLFEDAATVRIACMPAKPRAERPVVVAQDGTPIETPVIDSLNEPTEIPRLGLVRTVTSLALTGDDRKKAESATIGIKRIRTEEDDGSTKTTTTLSFDGTLGLRLTGDQAAYPIFLYTNYTLSRDRTKPASALGPDERRDDKDTNGLAIGLSIDDVALPFRASLSGQASFVSDYVKGARRGVGSIFLTPGWMPTDLGICGLGKLKPIAISSIAFRTQCMVAGEIDYSHVFRAGRADFKEHGNFLSTGIVVGIDLVPPLFEKSGVVSSFRYRFLPTVSGTAPDVRRIEAAFKYRWWVADASAIDFGFTYRRGEEFKTYTMEDALELAFGVIF
ncbi:MAG: hypothetical protein J7530_06230 [Novosphingobium sp.]|nr:hypothetical protein [Novosphingobium sp.]